MSLSSREDFFSEYLQYTDANEVPKTFHRWSAIATIGALLGRNICVPFGHSSIYPNIYAMLIGTPGTRKSTAIKIAKSLLPAVGYTTIAAEKTTKEKFLLDLAGAPEGEETAPADKILEQNLWGGDTTEETHEIFIMADEFNDFFGNGNLEFISLLGNLWDFSGQYRNRVKNSKSVVINNPTVSILGGNTPTGFSVAFPPEVIGQGFFSRLILVYGEPSGKRIAFPKPPSLEATSAIVTRLQQIRETVRGLATLEPTAEKLLEKIYNTWPGFEDDVRFDSYANRRFPHLLKLCIIHAAARCSAVISEEDVIAANTVLTHTEHLMPKALGEFGKAKHADVSHKVMSFIYSQHDTVKLKEIWKRVHSDLEKQSDLIVILQNLTAADKIQSTPQGFLPKRRPIVEASSDTLDYSYLSQEEKELKK